MITDSNQACMAKITGRRVQESIFGRTPSDPPQVEGLPTQNLAASVIRIEELKRLLVRSSFRPTHLPGSSIRATSRLRAVIDRTRPENGDILYWEDQVTVCPFWRDDDQRDMIVDACPQRRIKEKGDQAELGEQRHETLSPVAMSPANRWSTMVS
jgi:hypothetical protein